MVECTDTTSWHAVYSAKFSWVFNFANFANFQPFAKLLQRKYLHVNYSFHVQECRWTTSQGYAAESARDALQRDTFEVGIALLRDANSKCGRRCDSAYTVKTYGLLQPYVGHLSCMPAVYVTCCKTSKDASNQNQSLSVVEKLLLFKLGSCRKPNYIKPSYLAAFLAFLT